MDKEFEEYDGIILDVDGTLYYQFPVRCCMFFQLLKFVITNPLHYREILVICKFRSTREKGISDQGHDFSEQVSILAQQFSIPETEVRRILQKWMRHVPLKYIEKYKDETLLEMMEQWYYLGIKVILYSDHPVEEKANYLKLKVHGMFHTDDGIIKTAKPDPDGVRVILEKNHLPESRTLYIGDRYEKDGLAAKNAGVDFLLLKKHKRQRDRQYRNMEQLKGK